MNGVNTFMTAKQLFSTLCLVFGILFSVLAHAGAAKVQQSGPTTSTEKKVALVIGNSHYQVGNSLKNPVNDATDVSNKLKNLGFKTLIYHDVNLAQMNDALEHFKQEAMGSSAAVFYYAGHGIEINRQNFLVPVDAKMENERKATYEALRMNDVVDVMRNANVPTGLIILDACRDNPFLSTTRSGSRGLARYADNNLSNLMIIYAAQAGQVAKDGDGRNGVFTTQFLKYIDEPNLALPQLFNRIKHGVFDSTQGIQQIYQEGDILADFVFKKVNIPASPPNPLNAELAFWSSIKNSSSLNDFRQYLEKFPHGQFIELARLKINPPSGVAVTVKKNQDCSDCPEIVHIPASRSGNGNKGFLIGKYEVTKLEFLKFVEETNYKIDQAGCYVNDEGDWTRDTNFSFLNPGYVQNENHPVTCVSWVDATRYIDWLSARTGKKYRLPTAAEWQYAALAGKAQPYHTGTCINSQQANYNGKYSLASCNDSTPMYLARTTSVGRYAANEFGLFDMFGNVAEWTASCDSTATNSILSAIIKNGSPAACASNTYILKGGSWIDTPKALSAVQSASNSAKTRSFNSGFRVVRDE